MAGGWGDGCILPLHGAGARWEAARARAWGSRAEPCPLGAGCAPRMPWDTPKPPRLMQSYPSLGSQGFAGKIVVLEPWEREAVAAVPVPGTLPGLWQWLLSARVLLSL